jgi:two-component system sensor kinase FixL
MSSLKQNNDSQSFGQVYGDARHITNIFYWFIAVIFVALGAGIFIVMSTHSVFAATIIALSLLPVLASLYLVRLAMFETAAAFLAIVMSTAITIIATKGLGIHHLSVLGYPIVLIVASLVTRKWTMLVITLYTILCVAWLVFGELSGAYTPGILVHSVAGDFFSVATILIMTAVMVRRITEILFQQSRDLQRELHERKLTDERIQKQAARVEALASLSHLLTQAGQDSQLLLNTIVERCASLIGDGASIFLYLPDSEYLKLVAVYNPDPEAVEIFRDELSARPIRVDEGVYARVLTEYQPVLIPFISPAQLIEYGSPKRREYYKKLPLHSMMLAPLHVQGRMLGIIGMARHTADRDYTSEDLAFLQDIADRSALAMLNVQLYKEVEQELLERKRAEATYRNIFENAIDGIFQSTPRGRFLSINPAMARMYGYASPQEMIQSVTDISTQIYVDQHMRDDLARRLANDEKLTEYKTLDYRKDGSTFWTSMNVQAIRDEAGKILYYEGTIEDITERKLADEALRASEERYRTLFNDMLDGIYRSTHTGQFVDVNPAMVRMFGYESRDEMLAVDIKRDMYFAPRDRKGEYLEHGEDSVDTFRMKRKDGSEIWVEDHGHYIHDEHGKIIFHEGILRDVTPRLKAEAERRQAEAVLRQFKHIMDDSNDAIFIIDLETGRYKYFNERACLLLGYNHEELGQLGVVDIASHVPNQDVWHERVALVREQNGLIFETNYRRKNGTSFPVEVSARVLEYEEGETIVAIVRNIAERKRAEQERERLISELEAKNTELTQFTYTVSHDLKSPLVTINGFLGYLEQDTASGDLERVKRDRQRIQEAVNKMQNLLTELLELSRIGRMMNTPVTTPFGDLVRDALEIVHGRLTACGVTVQTQPNLPAVRGDRQRLTEVLQNLLDNAAKYMGEQRDPRIEIGQRGQDAEHGKPIFFVKDNGIGIEPEHHERIFGLFNKLDPKTEGTGIGLAIVKKIVEVHGGRIWVESEPGRGSTFCFTLSSVEHG